MGAVRGPCGQELRDGDRSRDTGVHHIYLQPLIRSDHLVRLNSSPPDEGIGLLIERGPGHTAIVVSRYKEWWGDHPTQSDTLEIDGTNVLNAATAPVTKSAIGVFSFDVGSDGVSNLAAPIPSLFGLPFLTGVDQFIPAADPPDRAVSVASTPRGDSENRQIVNVPNFASSDHAVSVVFNDFVRQPTGTPITAGYSDARCASLVRVASAAGVSLADLLRYGIEVFGSLAATGAGSGGARALLAQSATDEEPCQIVVTWSQEDLDHLRDVADAWDVTPKELQGAAGRLILSIIYAIHRQSA